MLTKLVALRQKSHQNLSLLNIKCAARISTPRREGGGVRAWNFENDRAIKSTNSKTKKLKNPKNKNSFIDVLESVH